MAAVAAEETDEAACPAAEAPEEAALPPDEAALPPEEAALPLEAVGVAEALAAVDSAALAEATTASAADPVGISVLPSFLASSICLHALVNSVVSALAQFRHLTTVSGS